MPARTTKFQHDLPDSLMQMRRGQAARVTTVERSPAAEARAGVGLSQKESARREGIPTSFLAACM